MSHVPSALQRDGSRELPKLSLVLILQEPRVQLSRFGDTCCGLEFTISVDSSETAETCFDAATATFVVPRHVRNDEAQRETEFVGGPQPACFLSTMLRGH